MANTYITTVSATVFVDIKAALIAKYPGITIHYDTSPYLIFSCPQISNKVIKLRFDANWCGVYYGDEWTSGSTVTNQISVSGGNIAPANAHIILGDNTLIIFTIPSTASNSHMSIIGKLTNDEFAACSLTLHSSGSYSQINRNTTSDLDFLPKVLYEDFVFDDNTLAEMPLLIRYLTGDVATNTDGSIASFRDISNVSFAYAATPLVVGNRIFFPSGMRTGDFSITTRTCLSAEFEV